MGRSIWELPSDYEIWQRIVIKHRGEANYYRKKALNDKRQHTALKKIKKAIEADIKEGND